MSKPARQRLPWDPIDLTRSELASIKAVADGVAQGEQQRIAFRAIQLKLCAVDQASFTVLPGSEDGRRATDFAEGKRWVGLTLRQVLGHQYPVNPRGPEPPMPEPAQPAKDET